MEYTIPIVERSWVTVVGWSPMAVVNTLWQACERGIIPHRVVLLASPSEASVQRSINIIQRYLQATLPRFGVDEPVIEQKSINEDDFLGFHDTLAKVLAEECQRSDQVVVDTTPGRKYMSAFAIALGIQQSPKLERVYYNHMLDQRYNDVAHPLIPRHEQQLYDLMEFLKR
ncbi:MAG: hypothetical protein L0229_09045 [Blastocatellia bacterium]|nr:hypothetical protein [Blastocatellia bacterium]